MVALPHGDCQFHKPVSKDQGDHTEKVDMKTHSIASGIVMALSLVGVGSLAGCSAETGAPEGANVESTSQAIRIKNSCDNTKTDLGNGYTETQFPSYLKLSNTQVLVSGGYDSTSTAQTKIKVGTWDGGATPPTFSFGNPSGTAINLSESRAEFPLVAVPGVANKYFAIGGLSAKSSGSFRSSVDLIDLGTPSSSAISGQALGKDNGTGTAVGAARLAAVACGTGSKVLVIGGNESGSASARLQVIDYNSGSPTIKPLKNKDDHSTVVQMGVARINPGAYAISANKILVFGGEAANGTALSSTELIDVTNDCEFDDKDAGQTLDTTAAGTAMTEARTKFVFAPISYTVSTVTYDLLVAGGTAGTTAPTSTLAYDVDTDAWTNGPAMAFPHIQPALAFASQGNFTVVGGLAAPLNNASHLDVSSVRAEVYSSNAFTHPTDLCVAQWGGWASDMGGTVLAGLGVNRTYSSPNYTDTWVTTNE